MVSVMSIAKDSKMKGNSVVSDGFIFSYSVPDLSGLVLQLLKGISWSLSMIT